MSRAGRIGVIALFVVVGCGGSGGGGNGNGNGGSGGSGGGGGSSMGPPSFTPAIGRFVVTKQSGCGDGSLCATSCPNASSCDCMCADRSCGSAPLAWDDSLMLGDTHAMLTCTSSGIQRAPTGNVLMLGVNVQPGTCVAPYAWIPPPCPVWGGVGAAPTDCYSQVTLLVDGLTAWTGVSGTVTINDVTLTGVMGSYTVDVADPNDIDLNTHTLNGPKYTISGSIHADPCTM